MDLLDILIDAAAEIVAYFSVYNVFSKICILCIAAITIMILNKLITGTIKIMFYLLRFTLSTMIIGAAIYVVVAILIWFAENV